MKLTKQRLNRIIQEELAGTLREQDAMQRGRDPRREEAPAQDLPDWTDPHRDPNAPKTPVHRGPSVPGEGGKPEYWQREVGEGGPPLPDPGWSPAKSPGPARDIDPGWSPRRSPGPVRDIEPGWSPDQRVHQAPTPAREVGEGGPTRGFDPSKNVAPRIMPRRKEDEPGYGDPGTRDWFPEIDPASGFPKKENYPPNWPNLPKNDEAPLQPVGPGTYTEAKLSKSRLNRIIQEEYNRMLLEQGYEIEHPSGLGYEEIGSSPSGAIVGQSRPYSNEQLRNLSLGQHQNMTLYEPGTWQQDVLEQDAMNLDYPGELNYKGLSASDPVPPYTPGPARPTYGYTPLRPRTELEMDTGRMGSPGRGQNRFDELLTRQIERYIYKTLRG